MRESETVSTFNCNENGNQKSKAYPVTVSTFNCNENGNQKRKTYPVTLFVESFLPTEILKIKYIRIN
jgi:hypothetical protein